MAITTIMKRSSEPAVAELALRDLAHPSRPARVPAGHASGQAGSHGSTHAAEVEVIRMDGVVTAIEVHCPCGEVTVIELETTPATPAAPAAASAPATPERPHTPADTGTPDTPNPEASEEQASSQPAPEPDAPSPAEQA